MYSPKIKEELIPRLYRLRIQLKVPMTHLVNEAVENYLEGKEKESGESTSSGHFESGGDESHLQRHD